MVTQGFPDNICLPFQIENADVRGQIVRLGDTVDEVLTKHDYPLPVSQFVGELLTFVVMFGTSLKFEGKLSLQVSGDGPVSMIVADFFTPDKLRAYAQYDKAKVATLEAEGGDLTFTDWVGKGSLALIIDQGPETDRYQGFVPLEGNNLGDCLQTYFQQSEQLATSVCAAVAQVIVPQDEGAKESWRAGAIMLQHLPQPNRQKVAGEEDPKEIWNRVNILLSTTEPHELLDPMLSPEQLLFRLFHEDGVRVFDARHFQAGCSCDAGRVLSVLRRFDEEDQRDMLQDGKINVRCEFCNAAYDFTLEDIAAAEKS
ncbi:MAG: Hsp33 family molecular chaperone [Alphaproteobacteria bacterium]|nr:MAG: Hsp33 family molecular chaperone [Alphaproteobacteria bacterium]